VTLAEQGAASARPSHAHVRSVGLSRSNVGQVPRHLSHTNQASWLKVGQRLLLSTAWGLGSWMTLAVVAIIPGLIVRELLLVALAEPLADVSGATLSANIAGFVTWLALVVGGWTFFRRDPAAGRHQIGVGNR
jgi:hypothetical protein